VVAEAGGEIPVPGYTESTATGGAVLRPPGAVIVPTV
jgi:hypothetical protein